MAPLTQIRLEGGGCVLVEGAAGLEGPVKAGRAGDLIREVSGTFREALEPVTRAAQAALDQLRKARPTRSRSSSGWTSRSRPAR